MKTFQQFLEMQTPVVGGSQPIPSPLSSYDSTGARYTPDQMPEKYQQYKEDIRRVWDFIQAQSVSLNKPELQKIFHEFINSLKSAGFTGA
jgi:hypothetical protein